MIIKFKNQSPEKFVVVFNFGILVMWCLQEKEQIEMESQLRNSQILSFETELIK